MVRTTDPHLSPIGLPVDLFFSLSSQQFLRPLYPSGRAVRRWAMTMIPPTEKRLYVSMITSLDGYIEGPGRELDWFQDGNPQFERYCDEMIDSVGLAVYGRTSYELMLQYWPDAEAHPRSPRDLAFARKMNALPKVVLSRTLTHAAWAKHATGSSKPRAKPVTNNSGLPNDEKAPQVAANARAAPRQVRTAYEGD
jgi:hypothetical protein